jgi:hypothetical protein
MSTVYLCDGCGDQVGPDDVCVVRDDVHHCPGCLADCSGCRDAAREDESYALYGDFSQFVIVESPR